LEAAEALPRALQRLNTELKVPTFAEFGIDKDVFHARVPEMAKAALASGSCNNNPRVPSQGEVEDLYRAIWAGGKF
jgi:alcohol dehydrogenase class IV